MNTQAGCPADALTDGLRQTAGQDPEPENAAAIRAYEKAGFQYLRTVPMPAGDERAYLMRVMRAEHEGTTPIA